MMNLSEKIVLFPISIDELKKIIIECIRTELQNRPPEPKVDSTLISRHEAAKMLSLSLPTLSKYCKDGTIPFYRVGTRVRFNKQQIMESITKISRMKYSKNPYYKS